MTPLWANSTTVRRPLDKRKPKDWFRQFFLFLFFYYFLFSFLFFYFLFILFYFQTQLDNFFLFLFFYYFLFSFLFFYFLFILFYFQTQVARNKTSSYMVTKYPPVTPLWANSTTVRRPLDKMKPKDWFRHFSFLIIFGLKLRGTRHLAIIVIKNPPVVPL